MAEPKADIETVVKELLQLLGFATKSVEDPRLMCTSFQPKDIIQSPHAMKHQWKFQTLTELNLSLKGFKLKLVWGFAQTVEAALSDQNGMTIKGFQLLFPIVGKVPRVKTKGRKVLLVLTCACMCMYIKV